MGASYDSTKNVEPATGPLAAYLALLHLCGPEYGGGVPVVETDAFSVWSSTSVQLRDVLKREGSTIVCPELGTSYPPARAA